MINFSQFFFVFSFAIFALRNLHHGKLGMKRQRKVLCIPSCAKCKIIILYSLLDFLVEKYEKL